MDDLEIIINSMGEQNEMIDDDDLYDIEDEINSINEKHYFTLALISIKLGKPQILEYLMEIYKFNENEINTFKIEINRFESNQMKESEDTDEESEDTDEEENIQDIIKEFKEILKKYSKLPYKKTIIKNKKF